MSGPVGAASSPRRSAHRGEDAAPTGEQHWPCPGEKLNASAVVHGWTALRLSTLRRLYALRRLSALRRLYALRLADPVSARPMPNRHATSVDARDLLRRSP